MIPTANQKAERSVAAAKRVIRDAVSLTGKLNTNTVKLVKGLLQLRNTPDPDTGLSPAEMLLGISFQPSLNLTSPALRTSRKCGSLWLMVESWHWPQDQQSSTTGSASRPRSCRLLNLVTVYSFKTCWTTIQNDGISVESCSKLTQNTGSTR